MSDWRERDERARADHAAHIAADLARSNQARADADRARAQADAAARQAQLDADRARFNAQQQAAADLRAAESRQSLNDALTRARQIEQATQAANRLGLDAARVQHERTFKHTAIANGWEAIRDYINRGGR